MDLVPAGLVAPLIAPLRRSRSGHDKLKRQLALPRTFLLVSVSPGGGEAFPHGLVTLDVVRPFAGDAFADERRQLRALSLAPSAAVVWRIKELRAIALKAKFDLTTHSANLHRLLVSGLTPAGKALVCDGVRDELPCAISSIRCLRLPRHALVPPVQQQSLVTSATFCKAVVVARPRPMGQLPIEGDVDAEAIAATCPGWLAAG